jgi:hypothetical protein
MKMAAPQMGGSTEPIVADDNIDGLFKKNVSPTERRHSQGFVEQRDFSGHWQDWQDLHLKVETTTVVI